MCIISRLFKKIFGARNAHNAHTPHTSHTHTHSFGRGVYPGHVPTGAVRAGLCGPGMCVSLYCAMTTPAALLPPAPAANRTPLQAESVVPAAAIGF